VFLFTEGDIRPARRNRAQRVVDGDKSDGVESALDQLGTE
jgi:hypothetical protein